MALTLNALVASACADYSSVHPSISVAPGSPQYQAIASQELALFGLYNMQQYVSDIGSAGQGLASYAARFGIAPAPGESASDFFNRFLSILRSPRDITQDFKRWANAVSVSNWQAWQPQTVYVAGQVCVPLIPGGNKAIIGYSNGYTRNSAGLLCNVPVPIYASPSMSPSTSNGHLYICTVGGTSGALAPAWTVEPGSLVVDNNVTWREWNPTSYVERVNLVFCAANPRGLGTIDVAITSDSPCSWMENEPSATLIAAVSSDAESLCQIMGYDLSVSAAVKLIKPISLTVPAGTLQATEDAFSAAVCAYIQSLGIGVVLDPTQFAQISFNNGLLGGDCTSPVGIVTCDPAGNPPTYRHFWADESDITVTEV